MEAMFKDLRRRLRAAFGVVLISGLIAGGAFADDAPCSLEAPCAAGGGEYALVFPPDWDGETPLRSLVFYHGHNASMANTVRSRGLRSAFVDRGWLLIAPQGDARPGGVRAWPARPDVAGWRDDVAFSLSVLEDVAARVPLSGKPVVSGFSAGGSMAWMMACRHGARFEAAISVAGALRRPNPEICADMAPRALHIHGFADPQVPFEGRGIRDWHQGSVADTLALFRRSHGCRSNPNEIEVTDGLRSRRWDCAAGLGYLEHDGGHGLPRGWTEWAYEWLAFGVLATKASAAD